MKLVPKTVTRGLGLVGLACLATSETHLALAQGTATFINQIELTRSPDDVTLTPNSALAVIRGVDAVNTTSTPGSDEIAIIRMNNGTQITFPGCTNHGLTKAVGASDLVATTNTRGVLIGEHHYGTASNWKTCVDIVDLSTAFSTGPTCLLNWEKVGAGDVSDVAITPDERFASGEPQRIYPRLRHTESSFYGVRISCGWCGPRGPARLSCYHCEQQPDSPHPGGGRHSAHRGL
jgi:hypothetical protein